jgi:DNA-binding protein H-NS
MSSMIKVLEQAIEKVKTLSKERQAYAAEVLEEIAAAEDETYQLSAEERAAIEEGLAQADRGEFVPDEEMESFFNSREP